MKNMTALLVKFISCVVAFAIGLDLFFDADFADILSFSVVAAIVTYVVADRIILPRLGNRNALIADFFLTYTIVWIFGNVLLHSYEQIAWGSIISAVIITGGEVFVHRSLQSEAAAAPTGRQQSDFNRNLAYGTEFAEEQEPREKK
ncbi:YndM family protein [Peribacillus glennii]|uniref:DUF2512 family protein n=1 Tax=Peribacillus glennii TaxID=2303991 RepID=A0A372L6R4_9BACI|nr:YndM family protein [Peribacillus glennii]RFU60766.1 DUF2512 family protein [Peribacillus glennii]